MRGVIVPLLVASLLLVAPATRGASAPPPPDPKAAAAELSRQAAELARQGRYEDAVKAFAEAYHVDPDPIFLFNIGVVRERQGDLVAARTFLERYVERETESTRLAKGRERLAALLARLPGVLQAEVTPVGATIEVDGRAIGTATGRPLRVELAPGGYRVVVEHKGFRSYEADVTVSGGGETRIAVVLVPVAVPGPKTPDPTQPRPGQPRAGTRTEGRGASLAPWGWTTLGCGIALAAAGGALAYLAEQDRDEVTGASRRSDVIVGISQRRAARFESSANDKALTSAVLFGLAGAASATGVVLLVVDALRAPSAPAAAPVTGATLVPLDGGAAFGVSGVW